MKKVTVLILLVILGCQPTTPVVEDDCRIPIGQHGDTSLGVYYCVAEYPTYSEVVTDSGDLGRLYFDDCRNHGLQLDPIALTIWSQHIKDTGIYTIGRLSSNAVRSSADWIESGPDSLDFRDRKWFTDSVAGGIIKVTKFDKAKLLISANFEIQLSKKTAYDKPHNPDSVMRITGFIRDGALTSQWLQ